MRNISILMKPASSFCNIKCNYCFYNTIAKEREIASYGYMEEETLKNIVKKAFKFANGGHITFAFQGGEPTLAGLKFYQDYIELIKKYGNLERVSSIIQTNGILIDEHWANFFKDNKFLVGLSIDGPQKIHNARRKGKDNKGTFHKVMKAKKIFDRVGVEYNTLTVVDNAVARNVKEVYNFFKKEQVGFTQYIPCLDPLISSTPKDKNYLSPQSYKIFLKKLFDLWYKDITSGNYVSIRYFDNLVNILLGMGGEACDMMGHCSIQNIIEADGGVYPCDFYVYEQWKLGNINNQSFNEILSNERAKKFLKSSIDKSGKCDSCKWGFICRGECRRRRENNDKLNVLCDAYYDFFEYTFDRLKKIAAIIKHIN